MCFNRIHPLPTGWTITRFEPEFKPSDVTGTYPTGRWLCDVKGPKESISIDGESAAVALIEALAYAYRSHHLTV